MLSESQWLYLFIFSGGQASTDWLNWFFSATTAADSHWQQLASSQVCRLGSDRGGGGAVAPVAERQVGQSYCRRFHLPACPLLLFIDHTHARIRYVMIMGNEIHLRIGRIIIKSFRMPPDAVASRPAALRRPAGRLAVVAHLSSFLYRAS